MIVAPACTQRRDITAVGRRRQPREFLVGLGDQVTLNEADRMQAGIDVAHGAQVFPDTGEIQRRLARREFFILKAHGDASRLGNGIILTETDYREIIYRHRAYQSLLSAMFTMFTVVFVGASMTDAELKLLLNYISDAFATTSGPSHYALMTEEDITTVEKDRWMKDMKVNVIPVSKADNYAEGSVVGRVQELNEGVAVYDIPAGYAGGIPI